MKPIDYLILTGILLILGLAGRFIHKARKSGKKCIGCPNSCACSQGHGSESCRGCKQR